jgi:integrase/recombinase XerD
LRYFESKHITFDSHDMIIEKSPEMRLFCNQLFSPEGERLYLSAQERKRFLTALNEEERENRIFCEVLHYTGCRPSEALELTPDRILIDSKDIVFRSLKKRKERRKRQD